MRRKVIVWLAVACLAGVAWAGEPWKAKTYKEWNEKEVNEILTNSPWARPITLSAPWRAGGDSSADLIGMRGGSGEPVSGGEGGAPRTPSRAESGSGGVPDAQFILRWSSARTVREALARLAILKGAPQAEEEKRLSAPVTEHQIVLYGPDMTPFAKSDEMALMQNAFLKLKKNKEKVSPVRVEITRAQDGKRIAAIGFYFAMKADSGEPVIAAGEKGVDFELHNAMVTVRQSFDLQKMVGKAGPDLQ